MSTKKAQPVNLKRAVQSVMSLLPRSQSNDGCQCTDKSHRRRGRKTCGAPTPGRPNKICARCEKGHVHQNHDDRTTEPKPQRTRRH